MKRYLLASPFASCTAVCTARNVRSMRLWELGHKLIVNVLLKLVVFKKTFLQEGMNMRMYVRWLLLFMGMNTSLLLAQVDATCEINDLLSTEHLSLTRVRKKERCKELCNLWVLNCLRAGTLRVNGNALVVGDLTIDGKIIVNNGYSCGVLSGLDGQVLLGVTNGTPVFNYLTSPDGSFVFDTGPGTLGIRAYPFFGNVAYVDQIYGNDSTAAVNKKPYKTITAALAAAGAYAAGNPVTVWVFPGVYSNSATSPETFPLTIPNNVTLVGLSAGQAAGIGGVTISSTSSSNLIRMGNNTLLENANLQITSGSGNVTGISLLAATNIASIKRVTLNASSTAGTAIGIDANTTAGTIKADTMNITVSSNTQSRGVLVGAGSTVSISISNFQATGTNAVAAETTGGTLTAMSSILNGAVNDIAQTSGSIQLGEVRLVNSTANGGNFTNLFIPATITWATKDTPVATGTNVMVPATGLVSSATPIGFGIVIPQQLVVRNLRVHAVTAPGGGLTTTFTLYQTRAGVSTATALMTSLVDTATSSSDTAHSVTCLPGDILSIQINNPISSALGVVTVSLDVY
jgi:hypothetical protein